MRPEEAIFRSVEAELNSLLLLSKTELESSGVEINEYNTISSSREGWLSWGVWFDKTWLGPLGHERMTVRVHISLMEPIPGTKAVTIKVGTVAEIFQIGQQSHIRQTREQELDPEQLRSLGIGSIVLSQIDWGHEQLKVKR